MNEKYIPLYRKYRPQRLEEVVGQEHIKQALANAIAMDKISHAYLFTGPRGTGKTSTARIFAKSLNCVNGPTITPCGECTNCIDITNSIPMDVIEIDAASNRKVEDAQNILEKVMYAPVNSRFKIYIIDEVHMLSSTAFNALLKTLEEPPKNVVFILATTEVHKVLDTIKSRCQRFDFRRITTSDIVKHLRYISDSENIKITDDALATVAKNSAGGMRDSIALLDQLSVLGSQNEITTEDINALLGRISFDVLKELSSYIVSSNQARAIEILEKIYNSGNEPVQILQNLLDYFKNLLIVKNCKPDIAIELTQLNDLQIKDLSTQAQDIETHQIIALSDKCANYIKEIKTTNNPRLWLEIAIIDIANLTENTKLADLQARLSALENGKGYIAPQREATPAPRPIPQIVQQAREEKPQASPTIQTKQTEQTKIQPQVVQAQNNQTQQDDFAPMPKAKASSGDDILTIWGNLLANIQSVPTKSLLSQLANPIKLSADGVVISIKSELQVQQFTTGSKKAILQKAVEDLFGNSSVPVTVRTPLPEDVIQKGNIPIPKPNSAPKPQPQRTESIKEDTPTLVEVHEDIKAITESEISDNDNAEEIQPKKGRRFEDMHSDTVNMVMDIFDGKVID